MKSLKPKALIFFAPDAVLLRYRIRGQKWKIMKMYAQRYMTLNVRFVDYMGGSRRIGFGRMEAEVNEMERLTDHGMDDYNEPGCDLCSAYCYEMCKQDDAVKDCAERLRNIRLATYEDIGTAEEFAELKRAKSDGRLVVLPCAVGNTVWVFDRDGAPREMILDEPDIRCHCKKEDNLCMALCDAKNTGVCAYRLKNDGSDLGKKIFLTREAAEAALAAKQEIKP